MAVVVCGDSHTSTHGAFGALAFGIGTSEVAHVLATQCLLQRKPKTLAVRVDGELQKGVTAKDVILAICAKLGIGGATGHVIEYMGSETMIRGLTMEERMTVCNMSIEAGARAGMIAPDDTTFAYLHGKPYAPKGPAWDRAIAAWKQLPSDEGAKFDREIVLDGSKIEPMITFGTNPGMGIPVRAPVDPEWCGRRQVTPRRSEVHGPAPPASRSSVRRSTWPSSARARTPASRICADAAGHLQGSPCGSRGCPGRSWCQAPCKVKKQAEAEGLDRIFRDAGAEWREPGCSMCLSMNGDQIQPGQYAVSTSNRNFEGRQGAGGRTFLASPITVASAAVTGKVTDVRELLKRISHGADSD